MNTWEETTSDESTTSLCEHQIRKDDRGPSRTSRQINAIPLDVETCRNRPDWILLWLPGYGERKYVFRLESRKVSKFPKPDHVRVINQLVDSGQPLQCNAEQELVEVLLRRPIHQAPPEGDLNIAPPLLDTISSTDDVTYLWHSTTRVEISRSAKFRCSARLRNDSRPCSSLQGE